VSGGEELSPREEGSSLAGIGEKGEEAYIPSYREEKRPVLLDRLGGGEKKRKA